MSIIHKFTGDPKNNSYQWQGIDPIYSTDPKFEKHVLVGPTEGAPAFVIRYFQLPKDGASPLHQHLHEHGVIILHGQAQVRINEEVHDLSPYDTVFISGGDLHQIKNSADEPLGFFCTIPTYGEY
jgi:quercetin dioxygenase-like cupin family protein